MLRIHHYVRFQVKTLQMLAMFSPGRLLYRNVRDRTGRIQTDHRRLFSFSYGQTVIHVFLRVKELLGSLQTFLGLFYLALSHKIQEVSGVDHANQKNRTNLSRPLERSLMILLLLKNVKSIFTSPYRPCNVYHLIFAFALVIWRLRRCIRLIVTIVQIQLGKLGKAMFEANAV